MLLVLQVVTGAVIVAGFVAANQTEVAQLRRELAGMQGIPLTLLSQPVLLPLRLVAAFGLWRLRRWAWFLMMVLLAYSMAVDAAGFFRGNPNYVAMLFNVITVFYLNQSEVKELFVERRAGTPP